MCVCVIMGIPNKYKLSLHMVYHIYIYTICTYMYMYNLQCTLYIVYICRCMK